MYFIFPRNSGEKGGEKGNMWRENVPFPNFYSVHKRSFATKNVLLRDPHHFMKMEKTFFKYQEGKAKQYNVKYISLKINFSAQAIWRGFL